MNITYLYSDKKELPAIRELLKNNSTDERNIDNDTFMTARVDAKIAGCVRIRTLDKCIFELASLIVLPEYRNYGIGERLVREIIGLDTRRPIYLITHDELGGFYGKNGFVKIESAKLPKILEKDFRRIVQLPFAKNMDIIAMVIY